MLIESLIKREGGTEILMNDTIYHFKDDGTGCHVCEVKDEKHSARFLEIPEGFAEVMVKPVKKPMK